MSPAEALARNVRGRRGVRGVEQEELATAMRRLGHSWTDSTVSQVETNRRRVTTDELVALALALATSVGDLLTPPEPEKLDTGVGTMAPLMASAWLRGGLVVVPTWDDDGRAGEPRIETRYGLPFEKIEGLPIPFRRLIEPKVD